MANLKQDEGAEYTYDGFNRTVSVETFDGHIQINRYDAEGLRAELEENGKLVQFIFNPEKKVVTETGAENIRYIRGHELIASDAESARTYYHYASNELGSITHLSDETGDILNRYEYDAWGNLVECEERAANRFAFAGEQLDPLTRQYYLRARYYNPVIARFTQEDTYRGDGLNLYAYCQNNPVYYVDPSGHQPQCVKDAAAKAIAEGADAEEAYKKAYITNTYDKLKRLSTLDAQERQKVIQRAERLGIEVEPYLNRTQGPRAEAYANRVSDRVEVQGTYTDSMSASQILRSELYAAGILNPPYSNAAHHIVPGNDPRAEGARDILANYGIHYNSAANGVFLPMERNDYTGNAALHTGNHSSDYITTVTSRLREIANRGGSRSDIVSALNEIRAGLLNGSIPLNN